MNFMRRALFGLFLVALCAALIFAAGYRMVSTVKARAANDNQRPPARERQFSVNVVPAVSTTQTPVLTTFGEVLARRSLALRAPQGGEIIELADNFEEGGAVKAGDILLRIDPTDAEATLQVAQADLQEAEAELSDAQRGLEIAQDDLAAARSQLDLRTAALERQRNLATRGVGTDASVETAALTEAAAQQSVLSKRQSLATAAARLDQSKNGVLRAKIDLSEAKRALDNTRLTADFDGILSGVSLALGSLLTTNEQIGSLIDPTDLEIAFRVSTQQYANLSGGSGRLPQLPVTASLSMDDFDLSSQGRVTRESAEVGAGQTGRLLFARLETSLGLRPGDFVAIKIQEPALTNVARLPAAAVDAAGTVLALRDDSRLEVLSAPVLRSQGNEVIVDASEIADRFIVAERSPLLGAGIRVTPVGADLGENTQSGAAPEPQDVTLSDEKRAELIAMVQQNQRMPDEVRARMIKQLQAPQVSQDLISRLENRGGGRP
ncbi:biotin/lipoyl-binding protein [Pacificibacter maritimus]|uniref:Biotin/lipoyl-binding protein n=1 Tax=Pacificibacter maritimus TaxID=762213 RepID=A0A3N4U656_9RHOB|nr:biotin/lipoyl-binding protein [Pacificibacter maritimus]RPE66273.1 biotin/lipoyl-binding protein [Pacificibacter maritimus]